VFRLALGSAVLNQQAKPRRFPVRRPDLIEATVTMALITDQRPTKNGSGFPVVDRLTENGLLQWENTGNHEREFKYSLDLPGNSAAWRLGSNIGYGAVTIKNRTPWNE
jgi:hypothetical protein